jgi:hypothetical protein
MADKRVIACNLAQTTRYSAKGSLAYVLDPGTGSAGERVGLLLRGRGGRWIQIWQPAKRLENFRFKTIPDEHPRHAEVRFADWGEESLDMLQRASKSGLANSDKTGLT